MKTVIISLLVVAVVVGGWIGFEKYTASAEAKKAAIARAESLSGSDDGLPAVGTSKPAPEPPKPKPVEPKPAPEPVAPKPMVKEEPKPEPAAPAAPPKSEIDLMVEKRYPMPEFVSLDEIVKGWTVVPQRAFPQQVALKVKVSFQLLGPNGQPIGASSVPPGTMVKPLAFDAPRLQIASLANPNMKNIVDVDQTDFKERIENSYNELVKRYKVGILTKRDKAKQALLANPEVMASLRAPATWDAEGDPRFGPVKASLANGGNPEVRLEEAKSFRWNGNQRVGGKMAGTYDTVTVNFEVRTIFGVFPTEFMALMKGGQVVGWIDPITHEVAGS